MMKVSVQKADVEMLVRHLKQLPGNAMNDLRNDMRKNINPLAKQVQATVPTESPFKGMRQNYYGQVQWQAPKVTVLTTPSRGRGQYSPLVTLAATGKPKLGFDYTENAGSRRRAPKPRSKTYTRRGDSKSRSHAVTTQGDELIRKAKEVSRYNFKAGHFAYGKFLSLRPQMIVLAMGSLNRTAAKFNAKVWF